MQTSWTRALHSRSPVTSCSLGHSAAPTWGSAAVLPQGCNSATIWMTWHRPAELERHQPRGPGRGDAVPLPGKAAACRSLHVFRAQDEPHMDWAKRAPTTVQPLPVQQGGHEVRNRLRHSRPIARGPRRRGGHGEQRRRARSRSGGEKGGRRIESGVTGGAGGDKGREEGREGREGQEGGDRTERAQGEPAPRGLLQIADPGLSAQLEERGGRGATPGGEAACDARSARFWRILESILENTPDVQARGELHGNTRCRVPLCSFRSRAQDPPVRRAAIPGQPARAPWIRQPERSLDAGLVQRWGSAQRIVAARAQLQLKARLCTRDCCAGSSSGSSSGSTCSSGSAACARGAECAFSHSAAEAKRAKRLLHVLLAEA